MGRSLVGAARRGVRVLILGIETATAQVSVAIGGHEGVLALFEVCRGRRHAETLTPAIDFVCQQAQVDLAEIGAVAVDVGPGLFTGMRVGLAAAKAIAQARRVPMIGISSLDLLAFPLRHSHRPIVAVIDARKDEVFWSVYRPVPGGVQRIVEPAVGSIDEVVADVIARRLDPLFVGDGALRHRDAPARRGRAARWPSSSSPTRRRRRSCSSPTPGVARGVGQPVGGAAAVPARRPTRRSTGRRAPRPRGAPREHAVAPAAPRRRRRRRRWSIEPMRRRHLAEVLPIEQVSYPKPWSQNTFTSELEMAKRGERTYLVARRQRRRSSATPG